MPPGPASPRRTATEIPHFEAHLRGKLAYLHMIDPEKAAPMLARLDAVLASEGSKTSGRARAPAAAFAVPRLPQRFSWVLRGVSQRAMSMEHARARLALEAQRAQRENGLDHPLLVLARGSR